MTRGSRTEAREGARSRLPPPRDDRVRRPRGSAFLDGVNVAALALMAVVAVQLGRAAIVDLPTAALAGLSAVVLLRWRVNSAWLVLGGGVLGGVVEWMR